MLNKTNIDALRQRDLPEIMQAMGAEPDKKDRHNWRTSQGRISIGKDGFKWYNHDSSKGGGGAIDLVMHLNGCNFQSAVYWLLNTPMAPIASRKPEKHQQATGLIPEPNEHRWKEVYLYLTEKRKLPGELVQNLHREGSIYADSFANAVFLNSQKSGCELRGTIVGSTYHGYRGEKAAFIVPGDQKNYGLAFTESAIDALSYKALGFKGAVAAYGGQAINIILEMVQTHRERFPDLQIIAAFDNDKDGLKMASKLSQEVDRVIVDTPATGKDWNEQLTRPGK